jgi:hypothetical protein
MNLRPIIDDIASQADEFLADCTDRTQARAGITEFLALEHPRLQAADRKIVTDHVLAILEEEDFFATRFVDSFDADQDTAEGGTE